MKCESSAVNLGPKAWGFGAGFPLKSVIRSAVRFGRRGLAWGPAIRRGHGDFGRTRQRAAVSSSAVQSLPSPPSPGVRTVSAASAGARAFRGMNGRLPALRAPSINFHGALDTRALGGAIGLARRVTDSGQGRPKVLRSSAEGFSSGSFGNQGRAALSAWGRDVGRRMVLESWRRRCGWC